MSAEKSFAEKVIEFNRSLAYSGELPYGFQVLNPYLDNPETMVVMQKFYNQYYSDSRPRKFIIGINPGRHGAGITGIPFTDTKRLEAVCGIKMHSASTHEISSLFVYDMIDNFGGVKDFFGEFYINSPFPLAILQKKGQSYLNANYYDSPKLFACVRDFMCESLHRQISFGLDTSEVFVLGKKNAEFIHRMTQESQLFGKLTVLEHPRFIQQYKSKERQQFIKKYIQALRKDDITAAKLGKK